MTREATGGEPRRRGRPAFAIAFAGVALVNTALLTMDRQTRLRAAAE